MAVYHQRRVPRAARGLGATTLRLATGGAVAKPRNDYLRSYFPPPEEGRWYEANLEALAWMERISRDALAPGTC